MVSETRAYTTWNAILGRAVKDEKAKRGWPTFFRSPRCRAFSALFRYGFRTHIGQLVTDQDA